MSWGTQYSGEFYLNRISKSDVYSKMDELKDLNDIMWREILAYCASTPPQYAKDCEDSEYPWQEFIAMKIKEYREQIEENTMLLARLDDCAEVMKEHPENVIEG